MAKYDIVDAVNQRITQKLVEREVFCCMTYEVEYMLRTQYDTKDPLITDDDVQNMYDEKTDSYAEVFEWWAVSDWFGEKLKEKGEVIIDTVWGKTYWGRRTTGQAICLDGVIFDIAYDMEILKDMEHSWEDM